MTNLKNAKDFFFKFFYSILPKVEECNKDHNKALVLTAEEYQVWQVFLEAISDKVELDPERTLTYDDTDVRS